MSSFLKGNFQTKKTVEEKKDPNAEESVEARFEREALKRLGGSIAFVAKKKIMWGDSGAKKDAPAKSDAKSDSEPSEQ